MYLFVKKLTDQSLIPVQANPNDAGYDIFSAENYLLQPMERKLFKSGISLEIPKGHYGRVAPRSGLAYKHGIDVLAGVIDSSYRGEVGVILINLGDKPFSVSSGDRIAQLIIETCHYPKIMQVESHQETVRGEKGFGSSGL